MFNMKIVFYYLVSALIFLNLYTFSHSFVDAADPQYEACRVPKICGDQTISFPFFIQGQQESYCGYPYPGFNLSCDPNGRSILNLSGQNYVVRQIFYHNRSVIVSNAALLDPEENGCIASVPNLTLSSDFKIAEGQNSVVLLYNCRAFSSVGRSNPLLKYRIGCYAENQTNSVLAIYESDGDQLAQASRTCGPIGDVVVANTKAVDGYMGGSSENEGMLMREVLRRGFMLTWLASDCSLCEISGGKCGFMVPSYHFRCFCPDMPHAARCFPAASGKNGKLGLGLGVILGGIGIIVSAVVAWRLWKKKHQTDENVEVFLKRYGPIQVGRYSYSKIKKLTNSFAEKLGQGGFGDVYKGKLDDGRLVAVKVLNKSKSKDGQELINEVATISRTSHINVVTLLGFCFDGPKKALIYEFMPNGSLEKFIFDDNTTVDDENSYHLDWETCHQISLGIAKGLEYLHRGCNTQILHFDIKPHNILLDVGFVPKISDFGLAKICKREESHVSMLGPRGTAGYIAPEVFNRNFGNVSHKSDVYSYGMMVLEMIGGRKNINIQVDNTSEIYFPHWIYKRLELNENLGLKRIINEEEGVRVKKLIIVSLWCIQTSPSNRPAMNRVIEMLEGRVDSLEVPPQPFLYSPSRSSPPESS
ncbi:LEAF RUST 10 DISEASE-RESISTANCE LOCUS RECEPTOR-LIKE PROTEIN KINASE-like 2.1 [Humulus lupulus]|uniref:LEAF RUST 10 DISEASE-RESISTANCE LOCUS RECEPTOR-LIKE PROTEIN KINASE-like 2.1 n=1 Tax=Humulus lupulus TaxID=3486 RepID=UPI002B40D384|nr:LEAF RUST 10 DISEASE-RESISTANCE LOCUS RECEPTOR-LIKE PROTEIN KINASE-like 2.1 [Humulus lupulus]